MAFDLGWTFSLCGDRNSFVEQVRFGYGVTEYSTGVSVHVKGGPDRLYDFVLPVRMDLSSSSLLSFR